MQTSTVLEHPIDLHARAADYSRDGGWAAALGIKCSNPVAVEPALATRIHARSLRSLDALALALLDEASFHLGDHAEYGQHDVAHLASRRDVRIEHGDEGPALLGLVDQVEHIAGVATEAVEAGDHEFVTGAQELDDRSQFGSAFARAARDLLRPNDAAALGPQPSELHVEILVEGTDAGVTNAGHGVSPQGW